MTDLPRAGAPRDLVAQAWTALGTVDDPCSVASGCPISLVDMQIVRSIETTDDGVRVVLQLTEPSCIFAFHIAEEVEAALRDGLDGASFEVRLAHDYPEVWTEDLIAPSARARLEALRATRPWHVLPFLDKVPSLDNAAAQR